MPYIRAGHPPSGIGFSDLFSVVGTLISNTLKENRYYLHGRTKFPQWTPKIYTSSKLDSIYHDIEEAALPSLPTLEQRSKSWISEASWRFVNQKNALRKLPGPTNITG